jgi:hypothetical protein
MKKYEKIIMGCQIECPVCKTTGSVMNYNDRFPLHCTSCNSDLIEAFDKLYLLEGDEEMKPTDLIRRDE